MLFFTVTGNDGALAYSVVKDQSIPEYESLTGAQVACRYLHA
jgi:hypothetical protein